MGTEYVVRNTSTGEYATPLYPWNRGPFPASLKASQAKRMADKGVAEDLACRMTRSGLNIWCAEVAPPERVGVCPEELKKLIANQKKWQPIETAPQGKSILAARFSERYSVWKFYVVVRLSGMWNDCTDVNKIYTDDCGFTHWMSLTTPEAGKESA